MAVTVVCMKYFLSQGNIFLLATPGPSCSFLPNCPHPMETAEVKIFLILLNIFIKFCFSTVHCCCCRCPLYSVNLCNFIKYNTESLYNLIRPIPERNTFPTFIPTIEWWIWIWKYWKSNVIHRPSRSWTGLKSVEWIQVDGCRQFYFIDIISSCVCAP